MKKLIYIFFFYSSFTNSSQAQFESVSYDFSGSLSILNTNPGSLSNNQQAFGIPLLTNTQIFIGNSGFTPHQLLSEGSNFQTNINSILSNLKNTDHSLVNTRYDLFNYVWENKKGTWFQVGLYWMFDHFNYYPADLLRLANEGNAPHIYKVYDLKYIASKTNFFQTIYFGTQSKINRNFTIGYRIKLYNGIANIQSIKNTGEFYTTDGNNNYYIHHLKNIKLQLQTSGYNENADFNYYLSKTFLGGNMGLGTDIGLTYQYNKRTQITASLLDIGFIFYSKNINNFSVTGNFQYEGVALQYSENGNIDYWKDIKDEFDKNISQKTNNNPYVSWQPTRFYTSIKYGFNNNRKKSCENFLNPNEDFNAFVGITGFAQWRPLKIHSGISAFYEQKWSPSFYTKINLTADSFSNYSIGSGVLINIRSIQLYLMAENIFSFSDLAKSSKNAIQFGINWVKLKP